MLGVIFLFTAVTANSTLMLPNNYILLADDAKFMSENQRLYIDLFKNYIAYQSPYNTGSYPRKDGPAKVFVTLQYSHLTQVIEVQMTHNHVFGVKLIWRDPRLTWNPAEYNNISYIYVRSRDLWMPEMTACESPAFSLTCSERRQKAKVNSTGYIEMFLMGHASFICEFSMDDFPFDHHWCFYCFTLPIYDENELIFVVREASHPSVMDSSEWSMNLHGSRYQMDPETKKKNPTKIYFDLLLSRRPSFWIFLIIIPFFLIGFLILLGLFFGKERNNINVSVALGLIAFESFTFIIETITGSLPASEYISILGRYIVLELFIIAAAILSVSLHGALKAASSAGYTWMTGDTLSIQSEEADDAEEEKAGTADDQSQQEIVEVQQDQEITSNQKRQGRMRKRDILRHRHPKTYFFVKKIVQRGVLNFAVFLLLHILNLLYLLAYGFKCAPELPTDNGDGVTHDLVNELAHELVDRIG